ncbi:hypothetical protein M3J09_006978 [Ascochyta lentis]
MAHDPLLYWEARGGETAQLSTCHREHLKAAVNSPFEPTMASSQIQGPP